MVPDKFNMVDMGGIDLIMMQGEEVPGLYDRLVESIARCRYQCLYNWLFDGVIIPPTYVELRIGDEDEVIINEGVTVTDDDVIHIYSLIPPPPEPPVLIPISIEANGYYDPATYEADGFSAVTVNIPQIVSSIRYYIGEDLIEEKFARTGSDVPAFYYLDGLTVYYYPAITLTQTIDVQMLLAPVNFNIRQVYLTSYTVSINGTSLHLVPTSVSGISGRYGIVMDALEDVAPVFVAKSNNKQYGRCNDAATMPTILNNGSGRTWYSTYTNGVEVSMQYVANQDYFIEVDMTGYITIKNFIKEG